MTEEAIKNFQSELTVEQLQNLIYFLSADHLPELKELARKKVKNKFIRPMRRYNKKCLDMLYNKESIKSETINLLKQTNITLKNVHKLIKNKSIVDANILMRSSFENLIMGMMINESENVYNEFVDLSIDDKTRNYTTPQKLRNQFRKILKKIDNELFCDMSNTKLKKLLDEFYDKLCLFTHSTLIVNATVELSKKDNIDMYIFALNQNAYFVEVLLYLCLKYLSGTVDNQINFIYLIIGWFIILTDINKEEIDAEYTNKLKELMYIELNVDYINGNADEIEKLKGELLGIKGEIELNPVDLLKVISEIIE